MLVEQHQRSPTAVTGSALRAWHLAAATAPSAVQPLPTAPSAVQPPPVATVDSSLAPILARAVQERALRRWERPATAVVQREVVHEQDWWDTVGNLIGVTGQRIGDAVESITGKVRETAEQAIDYVVDSAVGTARPSGSSTAVDTTVKPKSESKTGRRVDDLVSPMGRRLGLQADAGRLVRHGQGRWRPGPRASWRSPHVQTWDAQGR